MVDEREPLTDIFECFHRRLTEVGGRFVEDGHKGVERSGRVVVFFQTFPVFLGAYSGVRHGVFLHVSLIQVLFVHDDLSSKGSARGKKKGQKYDERDLRQSSSRHKGYRTKP